MVERLGNSPCGGPVARFCASGRAHSAKHMLTRGYSHCSPLANRVKCKSTRREMRMAAGTTRRSFTERSSAGGTPAVPAASSKDGLTLSTLLSKWERVSDPRRFDSHQTDLAPALVNNGESAYERFAYCHRPEPLFVSV